MRRKDTRLRTFLLLVSSLALSLVLAEFTARYIFRDITSTGGGSAYFMNRWMNSISSEFNSHGFRDHEFEMEKAPGTYRIVVIGDSFAFGQGIAMEERLSGQLQKRLRDDGPGREIITFARGGAETDDHIRFLREQALQTDPDFILLQWHVNDVEIGDKGARPPVARLIPSDTLTSLLNGHSVLYFLVNSMWQKLQPLISPGTYVSYTEYMIRRFGKADSADALAAGRALDEFLDIAAANGIPAGIVLYPELTGDYDGNYPLGFLIDRVIDTCGKRKITCTDLRSAYQGIEPPQRLWVNRFDAHPGREANRMAADAVYSDFAGIWTGR